MDINFVVFAWNVLSNARCLNDWHCAVAVREDPDETFDYPIEELIDVLPGYRDKVSTPMDFSMIERNVKKYKYQNINEFRVRGDTFRFLISLKQIVSPSTFCFLLLWLGLPTGFRFTYVAVSIVNVRPTRKKSVALEVKVCY